MPSVKSVNVQKKQEKNIVYQVLYHTIGIFLEVHHVIKKLSS